MACFVRRGAGVAGRGLASAASNVRVAAGPRCPGEHARSSMSGIVNKFDLIIKQNNAGFAPIATGLTKWQFIP